jgi:hypothetical protein
VVVMVPTMVVMMSVMLVVAVTVVMVPTMVMVMSVMPAMVMTVVAAVMMMMLDQRDRRFGSRRWC